MANVENIQDAEAKVAEMQEALSLIQTGLERAEQVAVAAEEAKARAEESVKVSIALVGVSVLLIILSMRRRNR